MFIWKLKSKIAYAKVTHTELYYRGSITTDENYMEQAYIIENKKVQIVNLNNGERLETYVIRGKRNSHIIVLNGPAARKFMHRHEIFILSYAMIDPICENINPIIIDLKQAEIVR